MNIIDAQKNYWNSSLTFNQEVSCFMTPEHGCISITTGIINQTDDGSIRTDGCGGAVDFDWDKIWGFIRSQDVKPSKVVMLHTHPMGYSVMSPTDLNMCQGWRMALGVPVDFSIITQCNQYFELTQCICLDGIISHYNIDRDENRKIVVSDIMSFPVGKHKIEWQLISEILYGMSKTPNLCQKDVIDVESILKEMDLRL